MDAQAVLLFLIHCIHGVHLDEDNENVKGMRGYTSGLEDNRRGGCWHGDWGAFVGGCVSDAA